MCQMLRIAASTCGQTLSRAMRRSFGTAKTTAAMIATTTTDRRIIFFPNPPSPPIWESRTSSPTIRPVTMKRPNCATVPETPATHARTTSRRPTSTPCFCRNRMFMSVDAAPVVATRFANDTAICSNVAGINGICWRTVPMVVNAHATLVDTENMSPSSSHGHSAVFIVSQRSLRLPTWPRITHNANSRPTNIAMLSGLTRRSSVTGTRCVTRGGGDRFTEPVEQVLVGAEGAPVRRAQRGLLEVGQRGADNLGTEHVDGRACCRVLTDQRRSRDEQLRDVLVEARVGRRHRRHRKVVDHGRVRGRAHVLEVERAVRDPRVTHARDVTPELAQLRVDAGIVSRERHREREARHENRGRRPREAGDDHLRCRHSDVARRVQAQCLVLDLLQPGDRERRAGVLVRQEAPRFRHEPRVGGVTPVDLHR